MSRRFMLVTAGAGLALVLATLPVRAADEKQTFAVEKLRVQNLIGRAHIIAGSGSEIVVTIARGGEDADRLTVERDVVKGVDVLRIVYPGDRFVYPPLGAGSQTQMSMKDDGTYGDGGWSLDHHSVRISGSGSGLEAWADLTIEVPKGKSLALFNAVGGMQIDGVDGTIRLDGASADVKATGTSGALTIDVGSGEVQLRKADGTISIDTGSGDVLIHDVHSEALDVDTGSGEIDGAGITGETLTLDTGSGDISLEDVAVKDIDCDTGSGSISVAITGDVDHGKFDTGSGDVTLLVDDTLGARLDIETGSGGIDIDTPHKATKSRDSEFRGTIGDGEGTMVIETGSGDVRISSAK